MVNNYTLIQFIHILFLIISSLKHIVNLHLKTMHNSSI